MKPYIIIIFHLKHDNQQSSVVIYLEMAPGAFKHI